MGMIDYIKELLWVGDDSKPAAKKQPVAAKSTSTKVTPIRSSFRGSSSDIGEIVTLDPATYEDSKMIAEHLCEDIPLIINMANLSEKDSLRTLDFILGLKEGRHGQLKRVTPKVFLLTPQNVMVNKDEEEENAEDLLS